MCVRYGRPWAFDLITHSSQDLRERHILQFPCLNSIPQCRNSIPLPLERLERFLGTPLRPQCSEFASEAGLMVYVQKFLSIAEAESGSCLTHNLMLMSAKHGNISGINNHISSLWKWKVWTCVHSFTAQFYKWYASTESGWWKERNCWVSAQLGLDWGVRAAE